MIIVLRYAFLLALGVIALAPDMQMPRVTDFIHGGGPIIPGPIFPFLFITIACGAISGFHSLVSSGTTPKMISRESQAMVGYGAMLLESFVGVVALISAALLIPGDYLAINTRLSAEALATLGFPISQIHELSRLVEIDVSAVFQFLECRRRIVRNDPGHLLAVPFDDALILVRRMTADAAAHQ